jgi:hypothetical protein
MEHVETQELNGRYLFNSCHGGYNIVYELPWLYVVARSSNNARATSRGK